MTINVIDCPSGFTITAEEADGAWVVTATETASDDTLGQWTGLDETNAMLLVDNLKGCDLSDLL